MSRYIDGDALIKDIENCSYETWSKGVNSTWWAQAVKVKDNIKQCIERQPTTDVVEVRHGRWKYVDADVGYFECKCSICNKSMVFAEEEDIFSYCPKCGAKMGEERKEENEG